MLLKNWPKSKIASRNVVLPAFVVIGAIALYNWIIAPHKNYLLAAQRYESAVSELAKKNQIISKNVTIRKKKLRELREKFKQIHLGLFDPSEAKEFFSNIQTTSEQSNCIISSLSFSQTDSAPHTKRPEENSYITANHAKLSAVGNYGNIITLINKLQDRSEQVRIDSLSIKPIDGSSDLLKCDLTITVYVMQNKERYLND